VSADYWVHLHVFKKSDENNTVTNCQILYVCDHCCKIQKETELKIVTCVSLFCRATSLSFIKGSMMEWESLCNLIVLFLVMLLISRCNLICSEWVHSILLFEVGLICKVLFVSADYWVHLQVFKKSGENNTVTNWQILYICDLCCKIRKETELNIWPMFLYFVEHPLCSLYREVWWSGKGRGDRVKKKVQKLKHLSNTRAKVSNFISNIILQHSTFRHYTGVFIRSFFCHSRYWHNHF